MLTRLLASSFALALFSANLPADTPAPGYSVQTIPDPAFAAPMVTLPGGDFVTFDGSNVDRWTPQGAFVQTIGTFTTSVFPSFAIVDPAGTTVILGESSNQKLWTVPVSGTGKSQLAALPFNYDATFSPSGELYVSAATGNFGPGNDIYKVGIPGGALTPIGHVDGPSGPLVFDASGALYYATQGTGFPAPAGSTDVIRWTAAQVSAGGLSAANATTVCTGLDGGASLAIDPLTQKLYVAETSFLFGTNRIRRVGASQASSPIVVDAGALSIYGLQFLPGTSAANFDAYQPSTGLRLAYGATDFFSASERSIASPQRPQLALSGPGLTGPGVVTMTLTGGVPNGCAYLLYCSQTALFPTEIPQPFPGFVYHTSFVLSQTRRMPFFLPTDATGACVFQIQNPGGMQGLKAYQFLVGGPTGIFVGSSSIAQF
ncbi:MAG TPA: hypothetical protein VM509_13355 [Planctomycetota bacterium]|nr:hypothetical protein [Planctomycetota bacterium]